MARSFNLSAYTFLPFSSSASIARALRLRCGLEAPATRLPKKVSKHVITSRMVTSGDTFVDEKTSIVRIGREGYCIDMGFFENSSPRFILIPSTDKAAQPRKSRVSFSLSLLWSENPLQSALVELKPRPQDYK